MKTGLILFAHGSRQPQWRELLDQLAKKLRQQTTLVIETAFLEWIQPDLPQAVQTLAQGHCQQIHIVPIFFGQGGHIQKELPELIHQAQTQFPHLKLSCSKTIGESEHVLNAICAYCIEQTNP